MDGFVYIWTLLFICGYFDSVYSQLTLDEYDRMIKKVRTGCQTKFPVDDSLLDQLTANRYPTDSNLMCHVNCALQEIGFIRNGNFNFELASKMIRIFAPREYRDEWLRGFEACQDNKREANGDICEWAFSMASCFDKNNIHFSSTWKRLE